MGVMAVPTPHRNNGVLAGSTPLEMMGVLAVPTPHRNDECNGCTYTT